MTRQIGTEPLIPILDKFVTNNHQTDYSYLPGMSVRTFAALHARRW